MNFGKKSKEKNRLIKENNNYKRILSDEYELEEKEKIWALIIDNLDKIIEIDSNDEIAIGEKIKYLMYLKQFDVAEKISEELLEKNSENIIALNYLSKIQRNKGNLNKEKEYLERIIYLSSEEEQQKAAIRLARINSLLYEKEKKDNISETLPKDIMKTREEEQRQFAEEKSEEETFFTKEEQEDYINQKYKEFIEGKITQNQLSGIIEELKKYPDQTTSMLFLVDLYSKITGKYDSSIDKLEQYKVKNKLSEDEINFVDEEIAKYNAILNFGKKQEQLENKEEIERKRMIKEQREYSKLILEKMKKGKIKKEELPEIVEKLENYPDKARSIFLIIKLYEIIEGRNSALKMLAQYTKMQNLSDYEKRKIVDMQMIISDKMQYESSTTEKIKRIYSRRKEKELRNEKRYKRKVQKETIIRYIEEGKNIEQIEKLLARNGNKMTINSIRKIRDKYAEEHEKIMKKILQTKATVNDLLDAGYEPNEIYKFIGYEIPLKEIKQIEMQQEGIELDD